MYVTSVPRIEVVARCRPACTMDISASEYQSRLRTLSTDSLQI